MKYLILATATVALSGIALGGCTKQGTPPTDPAPATQPATAAAPAPAPAPAAAPAAGPTAGSDPAPMAGGDHHDGPKSELGDVTIGGHKLTVVQSGVLEAGDPLAADVSGTIPAGASLYAWLAAADGTPLGAPSDSTPDKGTWHFHLMQDEEEAEPVWLYLRIRGGGKDERVRVLLNGAEEPPPHNGSVGELMPAEDGAVDAVGSVETVWDPKTGTVQVWFYAGEGFGTPMPIDADKGVVALLDDSPLELETKDAAAGHASKAGVEGLKDADLTPMMTIMFTSGGKEYTSELLVLEVK